MARMDVLQPNTSFTNPVWAKDFLNREHLIPAGGRVDPAQFPAENAVSVTTSGSAAASEGQTLTETGTPTGGTFTLTYAGETTAPIPYNATAVQVADALRALPSLDTGDIAVTGGPFPATPIVVTFQGDLANTNVAQMTATSTGLTGGTTPAVTPTTTTAGVAPSGRAGSTTLAVTAIAGPIPAGSTLFFLSGKLAYVTAAALTGATSLTVAPLSQDIYTGDTTQFRGSGKTHIANGTVIGRSHVEAAAGTGYGPASDADADGTVGEIYLLVHDIDDARRNADATLYRWGSIVDIAHLPGWASLSATVQARLRVLYQCMRGAD